MISWMKLAIRRTSIHVRQLRLHLRVGKHGNILEIKRLKYVALEVFVH